MSHSVFSIYLFKNFPDNQQKTHYVLNVRKWLRKSSCNQLWDFLEGMMLKLKLQYFGHLMQRADSLEKTDARRDWGQEEKGTTEDEMAGWHHRLNGCESEWTPGVGDGQGGLACCDSWESDMTERLNWTELNQSTPRRYSEIWIWLLIEFAVSWAKNVPNSSLCHVLLVYRLKHSSVHSDPLKEEFSDLGWSGNVCLRSLDSGTSTLCHYENVLTSLPLVPNCLDPKELKQWERGLDLQIDPFWVDLSKGDSRNPCGTQAWESYYGLDF